MHLEVCLEPACTVKTGDNVFGPQFQLAIEAEPFCMVRLRSRAPVKVRGCKGGGCIRIGDPCAFGRVSELSEMRELIAPARGNGCSQSLIEIAEKEKWRFRSEFFAHKQQRRRRGEQKNCRCRTDGSWICEFGDALAERAVSDLIVILKEGDERGQRQVIGCLAANCAVSVKRRLALVSESLDQAAAQLVERTFGVVRVVSVFLTCDEYVQCVVDIVIPLSGIGSRPAALF